MSESYILHVHVFIFRCNLKHKTLTMVENIPWQLSLIEFLFFLFAESARFILVLFHHRAKHNSRVYPTRNKSLSDQDLQNRFTDIIDFVYWMGDMYDCATNDKALQELAHALETE